MRAHTSQFGSGSLILYWSRIRKFLTYRIRKNVTYREQTEKPITEATLSPYPMERPVEQTNIQRNKDASILRELRSLKVGQIMPQKFKLYSVQFISNFLSSIYINIAVKEIKL